MSLVLAAARLKVAVFLFVALLNLFLPPFGTLNSLIAAAVARAIFVWFYDGFAEEFFEV